MTIHFGLWTVLVIIALVLAVIDLAPGRRFLRFHFLTMAAILLALAMLIRQ